MEDSGKPPWVVLEWLNILDLDEQDIAGLSSLDLEWAGKIVDLRQVDILHIVRAIVVLDLAACPVEALDLDHFVILDRSVEGDYGRVSTGC